MDLTFFTGSVLDSIEDLSALGFGALAFAALFLLLKGLDKV